LNFHLWEERGVITALHCAAVTGSEVCCELLIERGNKKSIENTDEKGRTPLHLACSRGHMECARVLLAAGAFVNPVDQRRMTPLMYAAQKGYCAIIEKLMAAEADISLVDVNKQTALHHACIKSQEDAALLLINASNIDLLNLQDYQGKTAMHIAGRAGLVTVVEKLLLAGASVAISDENDQTPALYCAVDQNAADCVALIICGMFPDSTPLSRMSSGSGVHRYSICGQNIIDKFQGRNSGDGNPVVIQKENASASSAQSSDSEFF